MICRKCLIEIEDENYQTDEELCEDCQMEEWEKENRILEKEYFSTRF